MVAASWFLVHVLLRSSKHGEFFVGGVVTAQPLYVHSAMVWNIRQPVRNLSIPGVGNVWVWRGVQALGQACASSARSGSESMSAAARSLPRCVRAWRCNSPGLLDQLPTWGRASPAGGHRLLVPGGARRSPNKRLATSLYSKRVGGCWV